MTEICPMPATASTAEGASGAPPINVLADAFDNPDVPARFVAVTTNVELDPLVRPSTTQVVAGTPSVESVEQDFVGSWIDRAVY